MFANQIYQNAQISEPSKWEFKIIQYYFDASRTTTLKSLFGEEIGRVNKPKIELDPSSFRSLVHFHKCLKRCYLNFQIISQIYYEAIIQTLYLFYILSKINPDHEILKFDFPQNKLQDLLEFYPTNPMLVKRNWAARKFPVMGFLIRSILLRAHLWIGGSFQGNAVFIYDFYFGDFATSGFNWIQRCSRHDPNHPKDKFLSDDYRSLFWVRSGLHVCGFDLQYIPSRFRAFDKY